MSSNGNSRPKRVRVVVSHPIVQFAPWFRRLSREPGVDLEVLYLWRGDTDGPVFDPLFARKITWGVSLLDGYRYRFLRNWSPRSTAENFYGLINPGVIKAVWHGRYDMLIVHGWYSVSVWLAYVTAFLRGTPVYIRAESPLKQEVLKPAWRLALKRIVLGWLFRHAAGMLYIGEGNRKFYEYYGVPASKLHFVPYAVDNQRFMGDAARLAPRRAELRREFAIGEDDFVILFLGKLTPKKRPLDLLQAYERLAETPGLARGSLVFVGDGPLRGELEKYVTERGLRGVQFMGFRDQTEVGRFYALADVFVMPSGGDETWGFVLNEAMCFGLPLVVSDRVGSTPDLVREGRNGYVFPLGDVAALARALAELVRDPERRRAFGEQSRGLVARYSYEVGVREIEDMVKLS